MKEYLKLLSMRDRESELSPDECERLNLFLSKLDHSRIPEDQLDNIRNYLLASLNINSVVLELKEPLENLLVFIEKSIINRKNMG